MIPDQSSDIGHLETDDEIRAKRTATLVGVLDVLKQNPEFDLKNRDFNDKKLSDTVEEYLLKMKAIKLRDKIPGRIQRHKVAGLMALAVIHNQPLREYHRDDFEGLNTCDPWGNSILAIYHGIAICAEGAPEKNITILSPNPQFKRWVQDFVTLLRCGSPCEDSLIHIFGTLCFGFFPENFSH